MAFASVESLLRAAEDAPLWEAVLLDDLRDRGGTRADSWARMTALWEAMEASLTSYDPEKRSACGLTGGDGAKVEHAQVGLCGPVLTQVIAAAHQHNAVHLGEERDGGGDLVKAVVLFGAHLELDQRPHPDRIRLVPVHQGLIALDDAGLCIFIDRRRDLLRGLVHHRRDILQRETRVVL